MFQPISGIQLGDALREASECRLGIKSRPSLSVISFTTLTNFVLIYVSSLSLQLEQLRSMSEEKLALHGLIQDRHARLKRLTLKRSEQSGLGSED